VRNAVASTTYTARLGIRVIDIHHMRKFIRLFGTAIDYRVTRVIPATFHCDISYRSLPVHAHRGVNG
jgi:hypothetical protein